MERQALHSLPAHRLSVTPVTVAKILPPTPAPRSPWAILGDEPSPENVVASQSRTFLSGHMYDTTIKRLLEAATSRRNMRGSAITLSQAAMLVKIAKPTVEISDKVRLN